MLYPLQNKSLAFQALWHIYLAMKILMKQIRSEDAKTAELADKMLNGVSGLAGTAEAPGREAEMPSGAAAAEPAPPSSAEAPAAKVEGAAGRFLTVDTVEITGRLGTKDQRELRINGHLSLQLGRQLHLILLILAWLPKCARRAAEAGAPPLPQFLPVSAIVAIVIELTQEGSLLAGCWSDPVEADVYRHICRIRKKLRRKGGNPNLIESGQPQAGYRLSTAVSNIILDHAADPPEEFWLKMFQKVLQKR